MAEVINFLRELFGKLELVIPTLIAILGSCGGVTVSKVVAILANVKGLLAQIASLKEVLDKAQETIDNMSKALEERDQVLKYLVDKTPNKITREKASKMVSSFTEIHKIEVKIPDAIISAKPIMKTKVKIKKA